MGSAYDILCVARTASREEIRRAYRSIVRRKHPDRLGGDEQAHEDFLKIKAAYEVLINPKTRAAYDADPSGLFESALSEQRRNAQRVRRRVRLRRLYE